MHKDTPLIPQQTQDGLFQVFRVDKDGDQVPVTVDGMSIKEGGTPITLSALELIEFVNDRTASVIDPGGQYNKSKLEGNIDTKGVSMKRKIEARHQALRILQVSPCTMLTRIIKTLLMKYLLRQA